MSKSMATSREIYRRGLDALQRELGTVGMIRFMQKVEPGTGDYSKARHTLLPPKTVREVARAIRRKAT